MLSADLVRVMKARGCPICSLVERGERSFIESVLYEHPLDPQVHIALKRSLGFCRRHSDLAAEIVLSKPEIDPIAVAVLYEDLARKVLDDLSGGEVRQEAPCPVCSLMKELEDIYLRTFISRVEVIREAYERGPAVLCLRHFLKLKPHISWLNQVQMRKIEGLLRDLQGFIEKRDYSSRGKLTEEELSSWRVALKVFTGVDGRERSGSFIEKFKSLLRPHLE